MQNAMCLEVVEGGDSRDRQGRRRPDPVRWAVQVILLALVSPALVAVLLVGGVCVSVQKVVSVAEHVLAMQLLA